MRTLHDDVLWRHLRREEYFERQHRGVLRAGRTENHALGTGVIADLPFFLEDGAALVLPPAGGIVNIVQNRALQHQGECHLNLLCPRIVVSAPPSYWEVGSAACEILHIVASIASIVNRRL